MIYSKVREIFSNYFLNARICFIFGDEKFQNVSNLKAKLSRLPGDKNGHIQVIVINRNWRSSIYVPHSY